MHWTQLETNTHQDGVIAHVIGATILGYFVLDETAFLLLDIGFIWNIFLDGEMGLLPHPVAISELPVDAESKKAIQTEVDQILAGATAVDLQFVERSGIAVPIVDVGFFQDTDHRRIEIDCETGTVIIETSMNTGEVKIMANDESELAETVKEEAEFLKEKLREQLGREPTDEEVNEWLREHTESY